MAGPGLSHLSGLAGLRELSLAATDVDDAALVHLAPLSGLRGLDLAFAGSTARSFCAVRPPGHHALHAAAMGFCLIGNVSVGAHYARRRHGAERVLIVDWDVHHGNGTQDIFYECDQVLFCSVHRYGGFYPGTGAASERGGGSGLGFNLNAPLRAGDGDAAFERAFQEILLPAVAAFEPELILVSAGFDAHLNDPLGGMTMSEQGFHRLAELTAEMAERCAGNRLVALLEGGYDPVALGLSVAATLAALDGEPFTVYDAGKA